MLNENIVTAFLAETIKHPPVGEQDQFMTHCNKGEHTPWGIERVLEVINYRIWAGVRRFGGGFKEVGFTPD